MNLTLRQLHIFEAVANQLSYTRAAKQLHLTQPAVSMQVKQLEESAGVPLFETIGRQLQLTQAGEEMLRYARQIMHNVDEVENLFDELKGLSRGSLSISVATPAGAFSTRLIAAFVKQHPEIALNLNVANRRTLLEELDRNERDLVIMGRPPAAQGLMAKRIMENPLVIVAPPDHPLCQRDQIPLREVSRERFVVRETGSGTRTALERFLADHGISFSSSIELASDEAIKQAVMAGLGLGITSLHTLELELQTNRLNILNVEEFPIIRHWYLVQLEGKRLSPLASEFKRFVFMNAELYSGFNR
ncbi:MAG: LysR family transcriptional regulator [Chromatiales bacterium]|nr:LysR family transcriptional regulator [Chromatiales bacterium]